MRFVQPIPLLHGDNHNNIGNQSLHNSPPTDNHHHKQIWDHSAFTINHGTQSYHLNASPHDHITQKCSSTTHRSTLAPETQSADNTVNTVCITSGGEAVLFSKYRPDDSRRSSQQSYIGGFESGETTSSKTFVAAANTIVDGDGNEISKSDISNFNRLVNSQNGNLVYKDLTSTALPTNLGVSHARRLSYQLDSVNDADEDPESPSIEDISCLDDDFVLSSTSTCPSISDSPEPSNFRGIINPNYPGFHHLAHTLSEHFFDEHHFAHSSEDSDLSEFEIETERQQHINANRMRSQELNQSDYSQFTNTINNNNNEESSNTLKKIEELIRGAFQSRESEPAGYADYISNGYTRMMDDHPSDNAVDDEEFHAYSVLESEETFDKNDITEKDNSSATHQKNDDETRNTPDILRKEIICHHDFSVGMTPEGLEQPDILRNVFEDKMTAEIIGEGYGVLDEKVEEWIYIGRDGSVENVGDIVGDFEQEVEHELGRMVSGYKSSTHDDVVTSQIVNSDARDVQQETIACLMSNAEKMERLLQKMADAVLSDGSDSLFYRFDDDDASDNNTDIVHCTIAHECAVTSSSSNRDLASQLNSLPTDKHVELLKADYRADQNESQSVEPTAVEYRRQYTAGQTAVVATKHQRRSYDDRELPPVVNIDREVPWYHNRPTSSSSLVNNNFYNDKELENNNVMLSPSMQPSASQTPPVVKKTNYPIGAEPPHRYSKKSSKHVKPESFNKELMHSASDCDKDYDSTAGAGTASGTMVENRNHRSPTPSDRQMEHSNRLDNISNNNKSSRYSSIVSNSSFAAALRNKVAAGTGATKKRVSRSKDHEATGNFDVYNIETALPKIDLEAIENHLKAAKEEERRKRNDRKEILRRLAMGSEFDPHARADKPLRKPSLHSRLQGGMNLQICFMNETASDTESPSSDSESCPKLSKSKTFTNRPPYSASVAHPYKSRPLSVNIDRRTQANENARPSSLHFECGTQKDGHAAEADFFTKQARLQIEARMALAQAKDMAHMQMEMERQKQKESPITEIIRNSLEKVGIDFPPEKRRVSRQMLTDMNIAQLQVIVNDLHTQIERLNERLVQYLMERDELHMSQDSMLVDIEDLTRYLGAKEQTNDKPTADKQTILMMSQQQQQHSLASTQHRYGAKKASFK